MNTKEFTEMFFRVIEKFEGPGIRVLKFKMLINKNYAKRLKKRCEIKSGKTLISVHDALFSILTNGEISKVYNDYLKTQKI